MVCRLCWSTACKEALDNCHLCAGLTSFSKNQACARHLLVGLIRRQIHSHARHVKHRDLYTPPLAGKLRIAPRKANVTNKNALCKRTKQRKVAQRLRYKQPFLLSAPSRRSENNKQSNRKGRSDAISNQSSIFQLGPNLVTHALKSREPRSTGRPAPSSCEACLLAKSLA